MTSCPLPLPVNHCFLLESILLIFVKVTFRFRLIVEGRINKKEMDARFFFLKLLKPELCLENSWPPSNSLTEMG